MGASCKLGTKATSRRKGTKPLPQIDVVGMSDDASERSERAQRLAAAKTQPARCH
jgi:hypothetical protein